MTWVGSGHRTDPEKRRVDKKYCGPLARAEFFRFYQQLHRDTTHYTKQQVQTRRRMQGMTTLPIYTSGGLESLACPSLGL
jgi:hypothetical protein